ncbi:hypothetical protein F442_17183 [Phytophthora nicotianae P10297]|uniref:Uncharacterized protein n=1 Tax=Phytophthora nicotianae P10297 TaxID=1317064 RepID=W2YI60_PHYNI|nr:hypothetical protein F442_17183 [Phytophthora nicotianae P10297]
MGMNKSYVIDIVDEVARVLYVVSKKAVSFPRDLDGWDAVQKDFMSGKKVGS